MTEEQKGREEGTEETTSGLTRRTFIKGSAAVAAGAAALSGLGLAEAKASSINPSEINRTVTADLIVVGSGTSGLVTANAAAENGADVALFSASSEPVARGGSNHAVDTKVTRELGIDYDVGRTFKQIVDRTGGRVDTRKWSRFFNESGRAMDWLIDKMEAAGYKTVIEKPSSDPDDVIATKPGAHGWIDEHMNMTGIGQKFVVNTLAENAEEAGVRIDYNTVAKQLVREGDDEGRVTAVLAENPDGDYVKYVGTQAVVLATGDFTQDKEMVEKYCPEVLPYVTDRPVDYDAGFVMGGIYPGDGHKMALDVGASWQKNVPNTPMFTGEGAPGPTHQAIQGFKGLLVNKNGVRYCNEDATQPQLGILQTQQPDTTIHGIWNEEYAEEMAPWYPFGTYVGQSPTSVEEMISGWEDEVEDGSMVKADSIRELAGELDLDPKTFRDTVDRYNDYCHSGQDEDFFKREEYLIPVESPPFYAQTSPEPTLLQVCGGLNTNPKMQVLDGEDEPIPGLYAVGTIAGGLYYNYYTFAISGINLGANCVTFGYLAGEEIAEEV